MSAYHLDGSAGPAPLPELPFVFARNFGVILIERDGAPCCSAAPASPRRPCWKCGG